MSLALLQRSGEAGYRLRALSADILPIFENCMGLSRALLASLGRAEREDAGNPPVAVWISLMRGYLTLLLTFWAVRRRSTRVSSAVSVQAVIELLTVLKSYRRLAADGLSSRADLATFLDGVPKVRQTPYFVSQIAAMSGLATSVVRRMCRNLETQGRLEFAGPDVVRPLPYVEQVSANLQASHFSQEMNVAGRRFVGVVLNCLAASSGKP